jgi:glycine/D-amino acid oxidase-like deaminating enzyme
VGGYLAQAEALPTTPAEVRHQEASIAQLRDVALQFVDFVGRVFEVVFFVHTGQGTSGICIGPGSGLVLRELIRGLQPSVDMSGLGIPT